MRCQILKIPSKDNATRLHKKQQVPPKCAHKLIWLCSHVNEALWSNWLITYTMKMQIPLTFFQCVFYRAIMHNVGHWKLGGIKLLFSNLNNIQISRLIKKRTHFSLSRAYDYLNLAKLLSNIREKCKFDVCVTKWKFFICSQYWDFY